MTERIVPNFSALFDHRGSELTIKGFPSPSAIVLGGLVYLDSHGIGSYSFGSEEAMRERDIPKTVTNMWVEILNDAMRRGGYVIDEVAKVVSIEEANVVRAFLG